MQSFAVFGNKTIIESKLPISFTFGNFDGVHLGHQSLIAHINKIAPNPLVVMTFDPHPANYFTSKEDKKFLTTQSHKIELLLALGVDTVIVQNFQPSFALLTADEFCSEYLAQHFNIAHIFLGYNLSYGQKRRGDFYHMSQMGKKLNWKVHSLPALKNQEIIVSSSAIRKALANGKPEQAETLLNRPYEIRGTVFKGDQRGREFGFPTANIEYHPTVLIPKFGVYSCEVEFPNKHPNQKFYGVMNCGMRPTVHSNSQKAQIEAHILDFDEDVYNEEVIFYIKRFIRNEIKFRSIDELKKQINQDVEAAQYLKSIINAV